MGFELLFCGAISGNRLSSTACSGFRMQMEGPTPRHALIHAATMVAAGVTYNKNFSYTDRKCIACYPPTVGALSAFIPATIAMEQTRYQKSPCVLYNKSVGIYGNALGYGAYAYGFFPLVTHAFFKAGYFLVQFRDPRDASMNKKYQGNGRIEKEITNNLFNFSLFLVWLSADTATSGFLSKDGILAFSLCFWFIDRIPIFAITGFW